MKTPISRFQFLSLLSSSYLPLMFWIYPRVAIEHAGLNAFWALLGTILVGLYVAVVHGQLIHMYPMLHSADIPVAAFGKFIGKITAICYIPVYLMFMSVSCALFIGGNIVFLLPRTPYSVLVGVIVLTSFYGATLGVEGIGRVASILYPVTVLFVIIIFLVAIFNGTAPDSIPLKVTSLSDTARGTYALLPLFLGFTSILVLNAYRFKSKGNRSLAIVSVLLAAVQLLEIMFALVKTYGFDATPSMRFPVPALIREQTIRGWIVERSGIVVILVSTGYIVLFLSQHLWAVSSTVARICGLKEPMFPRFLLPTCIVVLTFSTILVDRGAYLLFENILTPLTWILLVVMPTLMVVLGTWRKRRQGKGSL